MALSQITFPVKKGSSGGGGIGSIIGGTIGAIGGAIASGGNPMGAISGYGAGSSLGGAIGGTVSPGAAPSQSEAIPTNSNRMSALRINPETTLASLNDSLTALQQAPQAQQAMYAPIFAAAMDHIKYTGVA